MSNTLTRTADLTRELLAPNGIEDKIDVKFKCPVCLGFTLDRPYEPLSYNICSQCYVEYGYEDCIGLEDWKNRREAALAERHAELRQQWIDAGRPTGTDSWVKPRTIKDHEGAQA